MRYREINNGTEVELFFYQEIGYWWNNASDFVRVFEDLVSRYKKVIIRAHCVGGDVIEGNVIFNSINRFRDKVKIRIDGISASMFTIVMSACSDIEIAENGLVMIHRVTGGAYGNADQISAYIKLMRDMENHFATVYARKTGKSKNEIQKWFDGSDHWFTAQEAKSLGLVSAVIPAVIEDVTAPGKPLSNGEGDNMYNRYAPGLAAKAAACLGDAPLSIVNTNNYTNSSEMKKQLIQKLGLANVHDASSDTELLAAVDAYLQRQEAEDARQREEVAASLISSYETFMGVTVDDAQKSEFKTIAKRAGITSLQSVLSILSQNSNSDPAAKGAVQPAKPAVPVAVNLIKPESAAQAQANNDRDTWGWDQWQEKDVDGLKAMADTDFNKFNNLYQAKYGVAAPK
jgi:ATP-dependent Clp protease, protease subunit